VLRHKRASIRGQQARAPWLGAASLLAFVGVVGCGGKGAAQVEKPAPASGPPTLDVVRVVERPVDVTLAMPGQLDPYETVAVYPKVTGFVKSIRVDRGSRVRTGEVMALLDAELEEDSDGQAAPTFDHRYRAVRRDAGRRIVPCR